jgi:hypothetical protein
VFECHIRTVPVHLCGMQQCSYASCYYR